MVPSPAPAEPEEKFPAEPEDRFRPVCTDLREFLLTQAVAVKFHPSDKFRSIHCPPRITFVHTQCPAGKIKCIVAGGPDRMTAEKRIWDPNTYL